MKRQGIVTEQNTRKCGDLPETIAGYEKSIALLRKRIEELNTQIGAAQGGPKQLLVERRRWLYDEVVDMRYAVREMREYLQAALPREEELAPAAKGA